MRKLKLFFSMLMLIAFSVGNVWGADVLKATLDFTEGGWDIPTSGTNKNEASFTKDGVTIKLAASTNYKQNTGYLILGKANSTLTLPAFTWKTTKITVTGTSGASESVKQNIFVGDVAVSTETTGAKNVTNEYAIAAEYQAAGNIYVFKVTSAHNTQITTIEIYGEDAEESGDDVTVKTLKSIALSGQTTSFYQNAAFAFDGTCTATYSVTKNDVAQADEQKVVTPTSVSSPDMTTLGDKEVTVTFTDGEVSKEAKYTITVTEAPAAVNYEKVDAEPADWSGEYILVYEADETNARVWKGADEANNYAEATISAGVIAAPEGAAVLTIAKVAESSPVVYTIKVGEKYIGQTSDANGIKIQTTAINNSISYNGTDAAVDIVASSAHLRYNSASSSYFRYYKSATYSSQKKIQLYKKVEGTVKPAAGLAYAAEDAQKLVKVGADFTAPTLQNPNSLAVSYASNNTDVAEVAANGAVTIKAAGVAVITASFAGNDDFKAGSASYTIGVTTHAGTEADPYVSADVKIAIDAKGTVENAYATGIVSKVVTSTLPAEGYITFDFSADGTTTGQQVEAFKCKSLNGEAFSALTDVKTGATVKITGTLKKYNSTYEFDQNCHLVSYEAPAVPKTSIANDQANPYTVAQALVYAADGVTYDLDDYVYVQGVVYDVKSFNNGAMNIFIKDANAENQFELFKCAGINDGNSTTPFEALTDVQAGNIVIGYGQLTYYNPYYEFKQGNYIVDLQKPVTGIELDATAEVKAGEDINLTATILPSNATGTIAWTVESGDTYASVNENGVVTGNAEGEATIRATVQGTEIYAECTVTVSAAAPVLTDYYEKVTSGEVAEGTYLIVYEDEGLAFNGGLETLDAASNTIEVAITNDNKIGVTTATEDATFYINPAEGTIQAANGKYIGVTSNSNGLKTSDNADVYSNTFSIDADGNAVIAAAFEGSTMTLRYNKGSGQERFRYYASGQQPIALYKLANEVVKANPELAWNSESVELIVGGEFTSPTLNHADGITGTITYTSDKETVATVNEDGVISLVAEATGTAHITASYAGDENYKAGSAVCTIKVNPAHSIYVSPSLTVNFGSVVKDATVDDKVITVTLTGVDAATATLEGTNPEVFGFTPATLTETGDITISASSATAGTFSAKLTISDDAGSATSRVVTLKLTVTDPSAEETPISTSSKWVAATEITDGMQVIITGVKDEVVYAMGEQKSTNRAAYVASIDAEGVLTPGVGTMAFTLVAQGDNTYAIRTSDGKYLYAAGNGANHLKTQDEVDVNAKWTLTVASAVAEGSTNRNIMQFNGGSSKLFSCYASTSQEDIQFYVPQVVEKDLIRGDLSNGKWGTLCPAQTVEQVEGAEFFQIAYLEEKDGKPFNMYFDAISGTTLEAGKPYFFIANATEIRGIKTGDALDAAGAGVNGFYGWIGATPKELTWRTDYSEADDNTFVIHGNKVVRINQSGTKLPSERCYILINATVPSRVAVAPALGRRRISMGVQSEQTATGVGNVQGDNVQCTKVLINGQLFILRGEKMFDATGRLVK